MQLSYDVIFLPETITSIVFAAAACCILIAAPVSILFGLSSNSTDAYLGTTKFFARCVTVDPCPI